MNRVALVGICLAATLLPACAEGDSGLASRGSRPVARLSGRMRLLPPSP